MGLSMIILLVLLVVFLVMLIFHKAAALKKVRCTIRGLMFFNILLFLVSVFGYSVPGLNAQTPSPGNPQSPVQEMPVNTSNNGMAAALAVGLASIGAGIAVGFTGAAAIGGITQNPGVLGRSLVFVGLAEGIAIYGLIIAFLILTRVFGG